MCCTFRFAFIDYSSVEDATSAFEKSNGTTIDGRVIKVAYATEKAPDGGNSKYLFNFFNNGESDSRRKLYLVYIYFQDHLAVLARKLDFNLLVDI